MKYLLVLAVVFVAVWLWRKGRRDEMRERAAAARTQAAPKVAAPSEMARCAHCGLHLPLADAITGRDGVYCSAAHQQAAAR